MKERFEHKLATGLAVAAASLGLVACGTRVEEESGPRKTGEWQENLYAYPALASSGRLELKCTGETLVVQSILDGGFDTQHLYFRDSACTDGVLTRTDEINSAIAQASFEY